jgi:creatinine amidohydrolase
MIEEWDLTSTNLHRGRQRHYEVGVLPLGAIEPHNEHLPYGQDFLHTTHLARACCRRAWDRCQSVLCLPGLPYGVDCNLMGFPLTMTVTQATLDAMIRELIGSLRHHGIRKIVLFNGHGGNDFVPLMRQVQCDMDVHVFLVNWYSVAADHFGKIFEHRDDHAGELETSVALELFPDKVELAQAADGSTRAFRFEALRQGWARTSRQFARMSNHCADGNPAGATPEKGRKYMEIVTTRVSDFLVELAKSPLDEHFPFTADT